MKIHDITLTLSDALPCWPGDTPFRFTLAWSKLEGATVNVGQVSTSIHIGTHVDAPFHFDSAGATVENLALDPFVGPARVVDVRGRPVIRVEDLEPFDLAKTPRLLLRTDGWLDHSRFPESIPVLDQGVPTYLKKNGVILLGLDVPSVDQIDSTDLPIHHALGSCGITILESVDLTRVEPGVYELIALPLKIAGGDGSPVRAILRAVGQDEVSE
jgi:arylformamidase